MQEILYAFCGVAKLSLSSYHDNPWWNDTCRATRKRFKRVMRPKTTEHKKSNARRTYENTVHAAKDDFFKSKLENTRTTKNLFRLTKWHKTTGAYHSRPLINPQFSDRPPLQTLSERKEVLIHNLLTNPLTCGDIPMNSPAVPPNTLPFPHLSTEEIREEILRAGNIAPGADEIPTSIFRHARPHIEDMVVQIFTACLTVAHHPTPFREATCHEAIAK